MGYRKAPEFNNFFGIIESVMSCGEENLFDFLYQSLKAITHYLDIDTEIIISSDIDMNHSLKNEDRVIEICKKLQGNQYINPIGGIELYNKENFKLEGIELNFLNTDYFEYKQFHDIFISNLSIIDVLMFNSKDEVKNMLEYYTLK